MTPDDDFAADLDRLIVKGLIVITPDPIDEAPRVLVTARGHEAMARQDRVGQRMTLAIDEDYTPWRDEADGVWK